MPITLYEPRSIAHFEALEQTCRLHQLSGSGDKYFFQLVESVKATVHSLPRLGARGAARVPAHARVTKRHGIYAPGATTYNGGAMLAMPERVKVFAQSRRAAAMPTFARLFTRETPSRCVQKRRNDV